MFDFIDLAVWTAGATIVSGIIQWAKGLSHQIFKKNAPTWVWVAILPIASFGAGYFSPGVERSIWNCLGIWAISQIGYEAIFQTVRKKILGSSDAKGV